MSLKVRASGSKGFMENLAQAITWKPSPSVREIETQDGSVLLDIEQGLCLSMTPVGMMIWRRLKLDETSSQVADYLAGEFPDVPRQQIQGDVADFWKDLRDKELLVSRRECDHAKRSPRLLSLLRPNQHKNKRWPRSRKRLSLLLFWKAFIGLLVFDLLRLGKNFTKIHLSVHGWPVYRQPAGNDVVELVCQAVNYACVWYPKRVMCLQRSAVTTCLLRSCGLAAEMVLGAQKAPFEAHAWTEVGGKPIDEQRDVKKFYLVWDRW
jgi:hypothetical protein